MSINLGPSIPGREEHYPTVNIQDLRWKHLKNGVAYLRDAEFAQIVDAFIRDYGDPSKIKKVYGLNFRKERMSDVMGGFQDTEVDGWKLAYFAGKFFGIPYPNILFIRDPELRRRLKEIVEFTRNRYGLIFENLELDEKPGGIFAAFNYYPKESILLEADGRPIIRQARHGDVSSFTITRSSGDGYEVFSEDTGQWEALRPTGPDELRITIGQLCGKATIHRVVGGEERIAFNAYDGQINRQTFKHIEEIRERCAALGI